MKFIYNKYLMILIGGLLCLSLGCQPSGGGNQQSNKQDSTDNEVANNEKSPQNSPEDTSKVGQILAQAIQAHGGDVYQNAQIEFDFRDRHYTYIQEGGKFTYIRTFIDSTGQEIKDVYSNDDYYREIEGEKVSVDSVMAPRYQSSVNSVMYFTMLPFKLRDPAVQMEYIGESSIHEEPYDKIQVTFRQEGGGEDYNDVFVYWFHQEEHTLDYLAYSYLEDDGPGTRFREAIDIEEMQGIRFQDYNNYEGAPDADLASLDSLFEAGSLKMLSLIDNENIEVKLLNQ